MPNRGDTSPNPNEPDNSNDPGGELVTPTEGATDGGQNIQPDPPAQEPSPVDPYAGTHMEGRSPDDVKAYMKLLETTVQEQSTALTTAETKAAAPPAAPVEEVDFFTDPRAVIRQELETMVKPLNDQITAFRTQGQVNDAWDQVRSQIPDFGQYEGHVKTIIQGQNIRPEQVNVELLKSLYYTAVGFVARHGGQTPSEGQMGHPQTPPVRQVPPVGVPQHRPSSAPLPGPSAPDAPALRTLTENEARLAREWGMSHEEYLRYQSVEAEDVLTMDVGGNDA